MFRLVSGILLIVSWVEITPLQLIKLKSKKAKMILAYIHSGCVGFISAQLITEFFMR